MDTSEQYIKMCEKATEIQEQRPMDGWQKYYDGDFLCAYWPDGTSYPIEKRVRAVHPFTILGNNPNEYEESIWLPRQDQLQEMVNPNPFFDWPDVLAGFIVFAGSGKGGKVDSMEQLWLAFVMKEKYGKVWNGEDWKLGLLMI